MDQAELDQMLKRNKRRKFLKKFIGCVSGCILIGFGTAFYSTAAFGNDPYSAIMNSLGLLVELTNWEWVKDYQYFVGSIIFNVLAFIPMIIFSKNKIHVGTFINIFGVGLVVSPLMMLLTRCHCTPLELERYQRIIFVIAGFIVQSLGIALFIQADFGITPYDSINLYFGRKITYRHSRVLCDLTLTVISFVISLCLHLDKITSPNSFFLFLFNDPDDTIGWFTILLFFISGPTISFMGKRLNKYIFKNADANI